MRQLRQWLFNVAAGLSLLLFGSVIYFCGDTYFFQHEHNTVASIAELEVLLVSNRDGVYFSISRPGAYNNLAPDIDAGKRQIHTHQLGRFYFERITGTPWLWLVRVHPLFLAIATAILPLAWAFRQPFRRRASVKGHCPACGYNLTGNVSGTCPECGTPVAKRVSA